MFAFLSAYRGVDRRILSLVIGEFFLQMINTAYFMIFNYLALDYGYNDQSIASLISYRFIAVMILTLPLGFLIKGRPLLPILKCGSLLVPLASGLLLYSLELRLEWLTIASMGLLGASTAAIQVTMIPFIMRNQGKHARAEAIALHFTSWSTTTFFLGVGIFLANKVVVGDIAESQILWFLTMTSVIGSFMFFRVKDEKTSYTPAVDAPILANHGRYEWPKILSVLIPSSIIAIGAGLTIPFINLFFHHVFGMDYDDFSLMSASSTLLVTIGSILGPKILRNYGYSISITLMQTLAVLALVGMAWMQSFALAPFAFAVAIAFYLLRQPLMNMANPILSEFTMDFVGETNQELTSSLQQALWAGCWFFSSQIFRYLRASGFDYQTVFMITALIYVFGIAWYGVLIRTHNQKKAPLDTIAANTANA